MPWGIWLLLGAACAALPDAGADGQTEESGVALLTGVPAGEVGQYDGGQAANDTRPLTPAGTLPVQNSNAASANGNAISTLPAGSTTGNGNQAVNANAGTQNSNSSTGQPVATGGSTGNPNAVMIYFAADQNYCLTGNTAIAAGSTVFVMRPCRRLSNQLFVRNNLFFSYVPSPSLCLTAQQKSVPLTLDACANATNGMEWKVDSTNTLNCFANDGIYVWLTLGSANVGDNVPAIGETSGFGDFRTHFFFSK